jgi:hypothetical protein
MFPRRATAGTHTSGGRGWTHHAVTMLACACACSSPLKRARDASVDDVCSMVPGGAREGGGRGLWWLTSAALRHRKTCRELEEVRHAQSLLVLELGLAGGSGCLTAMSSGSGVSTASGVGRRASGVGRRRSRASGVGVLGRRASAFSVRTSVPREWSRRSDGRHARTAPFIVRRALPARGRAAGPPGRPCRLRRTALQAYTLATCPHEPSAALLMVVPTSVSLE